MALGGCVMDRCFIVFVILIGVCLVQCAPSEEPPAAPSSVTDEGGQSDTEDETTQTISDSAEATTSQPAEPTAAPVETTAAPVEPTTVGESEPTKGVETTQNEEEATTAASATEPDISTNSTPSVTPGPVAPSIVNFTLVDNDGNTCLIAMFSAIFKIGYYSGNKDKSTLKEASLPLPQEAETDGKCSDIYSPAILKLNWFGNYALKIKFATDQFNGSESETGSWCVKSIRFNYDSGDKKYFTDAVNPGSKSVRTLEDITLFDTPLKSSYVCQTQDNIAMESDDSKEKVILSIADLQLQPYDIEDGKLSEGSLCEADKEKQRRIDSTVPIAVGAALGCLILLVIIVYAIGRQFGALGTGYSGYKSVD